MITWDSSYDLSHGDLFSIANNDASPMVPVKKELNERVTRDSSSSWHETPCLNDDGNNNKSPDSSSIACLISRQESLWSGQRNVGSE